jgi:uncharacterized protein (DUF2141 family)
MQMIRYSIVFATIILNATMFAHTGARQPGRVTISGQIAGASGRHTIHVAIWDAKGFLRTPPQESFLAPGGVAKYVFAVSTGEWAITPYEDLNENGKLDRRVFGKEPVGFWPPYCGGRRPRFPDIAQWIDQDITNANITLR